MAKVRLLAIQCFDMFINPLNFGGGLMGSQQSVVFKWIHDDYRYVRLLTGEMSPTFEWQQWLRLACKTTQEDALY